MQDKHIFYFDPNQYRLGNPNLILCHSNRFLILPLSEVSIDEECMVAASKEALNSAFDVTPDLPPRVLGSAWKHHIIFKTEIDPKWAVDIARSCDLSAKEIVDRFMEV